MKIKNLRNLMLNGEPAANAKNGHCSQSIAEAHATVLIYDDKRQKWVPSGGFPGLSFVQIFSQSDTCNYRIVGKKLDNQEAVLNLEVAREWKYQQTSFTFHQWRNKQMVHGLSFMTPEEATEFGASMVRVLVSLSVAESLITSTPPPPPQFCGPEDHHDLQLLPSPPTPEPARECLLSLTNISSSSDTTIRPPPPPPPPPAFMNAAKSAITAPVADKSLASALQGTKLHHRENEASSHSKKKHDSSGGEMTTTLMDEMTATLARRKARSRSVKSDDITSAHCTQHLADRARSNSRDSSEERSTEQKNFSNICRRSKSACSRDDMESNSLGKLNRGSSVNSRTTTEKKTTRGAWYTEARGRRASQPLSVTLTADIVSFKSDLITEIHSELEEIKLQIVLALRTGLDVKC